MDRKGQTWGLKKLMGFMIYIVVGLLLMTLLFSNTGFIPKVMDFTANTLGIQLKQANPDEDALFDLTPGESAEAAIDVLDDLFANDKGYKDCIVTYDITRIENLNDAKIKVYEEGRDLVLWPSNVDGTVYTDSIQRLGGKRTCLVGLGGTPERFYNAYLSNSPTGHPGAMTMGQEYEILEDYELRIGEKTYDIGVGYAYMDIFGNACLFLTDSSLFASSCDVEEDTMEDLCLNTLRYNLGDKGGVWPQERIDTKIKWCYEEKYQCCCSKCGADNDCELKEKCEEHENVPCEDGCRVAKVSGV